MPTFVPNTLAESTLIAGSKGGQIYIKGVTVRLGFDILRIWKIQIDKSTDQATGTPYWGCIYIASRTFPVTLCYRKKFGYVGYIYHRGAFGVARF